MKELYFIPKSDSLLCIGRLGNNGSKAALRYAWHNLRKAEAPVVRQVTEDLRLNEHHKNPVLEVN